MKVMFSLRNFLPNHIAGTEIYVNALGKCLRELGAQTVVVKPGFDIMETREYSYGDQRVIEYPQSSAFDKEVILGTKPPSGIVFFEQVIRDEKPDIIHFHEIGSSNGITIAHMDVANSMGIPVFTTMHLVGYVCKTGTLRYKNAESCDGIIDNYKCAVCSLHERGLRFGMAELAVNLGNTLTRKKQVAGRETTAPALFSYPKYIDIHRKLLQQVFTGSQRVFILSEWFRLLLIRNGMPATKMVLLDKALPHFERPIPVEPGHSISPKGLRFVYMGRISEIKGLHLLLQALNNIRPRNWTLDIYGQVGEVDYEEKCRKLARKNKENIFFRAPVAPEEVLGILQQYDAMICPTIIEEMVGLVVMEAFAVGIPVIGSDSKGIAEQVTNGVNGLLFKSGSADSLVKLLKKVLDDPEMLNMLKQNIQIPLDFNVVAKQVFDTYTTILLKNASI